MPDRSCHKPWALEPVADRLIDDLSQATGLSRTVARMLAARGVANAEEARRFLNPSLEREWLDPMLISGMGEGAERVARAVCAQERIVVFGDFDLDGISAAAVATRGLAAMGADVQALIPHRFAEGYGLTVASIERVLALKPALLVTVDCGISSAQEVEMLVSHGVDVVVTDHHEPTESVPASVPVVNPKVGPDGVSRDLAGAGVALKLIQAVGAKLGYPGTWRLLADLATLGTVADSVPLLGENRALVAEGIASMSRVPRACISALAGIAGLLPVDLTSESIGYVLAPRLNAAGRMADPTDALKLLLADDPSEAERLAVALDEHNRCRQEVEGRLSAEVLELAHETYRGERAVILAGSGWHEGVKGIVASRLADVFGVPALLFSIEDGVARGSGRSVGDIDLFAALDTCCASVLTRYGGHAAAVGMALPADELPKLKACLLECLDTLPAEKLMARRMIDAQVSLGELSISLGTEIAALEPFGHGNTRPLLMVPGVFMTGRGRVGKADDHLKFTAYDGASSVPAIAFRCKDIDRLMEHEAVVDVAFELNTDEWRGRRRM
ncbi:MAG: single-stranded-DNA-specific exonuclease RecJ, partial [Coriobacteriia bacterium]|nr:single-stranded-DNA-specific exonuclease RecJ [Coriobacteriia bacterium]